MTSTLRLCWERSSGDAAPFPGSSSSLCPYPSWSTASPPTTRIGVTKPKKEQKREQFTIKMHHPGCGEMRWTWGRERGRGSRPRSWGKCRRCFFSRRCPLLVSVTCAVLKRLTPPCALCISVHKTSLLYTQCAGKMVAEQPDLCGGKVSANKAGQRLHTNTSKLSRIL